MNVIVIVTDSLRQDHLGCYGNPWIQTPHSDALAAESTLFTAAYSEGIATIPTRTSFFTGRYTFPYRGWQRLEPDDVLLAEVLWDQNYDTALVSDTYHMHKPGMGFGRGFDHVHWIRGQEGGDPYTWDPHAPVDDSRYIFKDDGRGGIWGDVYQAYLRNTAHWQGEEDTFVAQVVRAGLRWLESRRRKDRLFLWLDAFDPHEPWNPPQPYLTMYGEDDPGPYLIYPCPGPTEGYLSAAEIQQIRNIYAGKVTLADKWVGVFLQGLKDLGLYEDSLIIRTTDHGKPLGEHGLMRQLRPWPYQVVVNFPLMIRHPEGVGKGRVVHGYVQPPDVAPTILDYLGVEVPATMQGASLLPLVRGERETVRDAAYVMGNGSTFCGWTAGPQNSTTSPPTRTR